MSASIQRVGGAVAATAAALSPNLALAAPTDLHLDGSGLSLIWVIPFAGMLLSIALGPLVFPRIWHHHFGKIAIGWALAFLIPCGMVFGPETALYQAWHAFILEYVPFILLLFALFTVAGGIRLKGTLVGTPIVNLGLLLIGTILASWMGTTGAAMLLIRPLLRANENRRYKIHTVVFFIFLVANIGGSLTPLGDPPLFLGFLKGVPFFWTLEHLLEPFLFVSAILLVLYYVIDKLLYMREQHMREQATADVPADAVVEKEKLGLEGWPNFLLLAGIVGAVLMSGKWQPGTVTIYHVEIGLESLARDGLLILIALLSLWWTRSASRTLNGFTWFPIVEVGKLFIGIFLAMIPAIAILQAGENGAFGPLIDLVSDSNGQPVDAAYFWLTGGLSAFLDNAPTYLVFFNMAGGDPEVLTTTLSPTLIAISCGAVFMGAVTYIGNAPNFMVRSIAEDAGVKMPSFFGYMAWSVGILVPVFAILTVVYFL